MGICNILHVAEIELLRLLFNSDLLVAISIRMMTIKTNFKIISLLRKLTCKVSVLFYVQI